jgi:hypothetical protein
MLALITFLCCSILVYQNRNKMTDLLKLKYKMLIPSIKNSLNELIDLLEQMSNTEFSKPCQLLSNSTIGNIPDISSKCFNVSKIIITLGLKLCTKNAQEHLK